VERFAKRLINYAVLALLAVAFIVFQALEEYYLSGLICGLLVVTFFVVLNLKVRQWPPPVKAGVVTAVVCLTTLVVGWPWLHHSGKQQCRDANGSVIAPDGRTWSDQWKEAIVQCCFLIIVAGQVSLLCVVPETQELTDLHIRTCCLFAWLGRCSATLADWSDACQAPGYTFSDHKEHFLNDKAEARVSIFSVFTDTAAVFSTVWALVLLVFRLRTLEVSFGEKLPRMVFAEVFLAVVYPLLILLSLVMLLFLPKLEVIYGIPAVDVVIAGVLVLLLYTTGIIWFALAKPLRLLRDVIQPGQGQMLPPCGVEHGQVLKHMSTMSEKAVMSGRDLRWRRIFIVMVIIGHAVQVLMAVIRSQIPSVETKLADKILNGFCSCVMLAALGEGTLKAAIDLSRLRFEESEGCFAEPAIPCTCNGQAQQGCDGCTWDAEVRKLADRLVCPESLLLFYLALGQDPDSNSRVYPFDKGKANDARLMPHFDPRISSTGDVVWQGIIPASRSARADGGRSLAEVLHKRPSGHRGGRHPCMVTHHWGNVFSHLVSAVVADALGHYCSWERIEAELTTNDWHDRKKNVYGLLRQLDRRGAANFPYWLCICCVNQHKSICHLPPPGCTDRVTCLEYQACTCKEPKFGSGEPLFCEMNKFDAMMRFQRSRFRHFSHVIAVDLNYDLFTRAWCVAELWEGHFCRLQQKVLSHSPRAIEANVYKVQSIDVRECNATREEDKISILEKVGDEESVAKFNNDIHELILGKHGLLYSDGAHTALSNAGMYAARVKYMRSNALRF